jgi:hypothetical protein
MLHGCYLQIILCHKAWWYEWMRCSRIKQNCCRMWACKKHTQYHIMGLLSFLASHMVDLAVHVVLLCLWPWLVSYCRNRLFVGAFLGKVARHAALETFTDTLISLSWGVLRGLSCWMRLLRKLWMMMMLHIRPTCLLLRVLHLKTRLLHLKTGSLHWKRMTLSLHRWVNHLRCPEEGARLR